MTPTPKTFLDVAVVTQRAEKLAGFILTMYPTGTVFLHGVPRGGVPAAYAVAQHSNRFRVVSSIPYKSNAVVIDDIIDSGHTRARYIAAHPTKPFLALVNKKDEASDAALGWVVFPWEHAEETDNSIVGTIRNRLKSREENSAAGFGPADSVHGAVFDGEMPVLMEEIERRAKSFLDSLLLDTQSPHLLETPRRLARLYVEGVCRGRYEPQPKITTFRNSRGIDDPQVIGPISLRSLCAHHFCPIVGNVWVAYQPGDWLIGLSKFHRLTDWVSSRPQVQEELAHTLAGTLHSVVKSRALLVYVRASHSCVSWRGVRDHPAGEMVSVSFRGDATNRSELLSLVQQKPG